MQIKMRHKPQKLLLAVVYFCDWSSAGGVSVCVCVHTRSRVSVDDRIQLYQKKEREKNYLYISIDPHKGRKNKTDGEKKKRRRRRHRLAIMYRDYLYSIDLLGRIVNTRDERRCALSTDLRRADGTWKARARHKPHTQHTHTQAGKAGRKKIFGRAPDGQDDIILLLE